VAPENPIDPRYRPFMTAIRRRVCAVCMDQKDDGSCGLHGHVCAIEKHMPAVVDVLMALDDHRMDDYVTAVEAEVCGHCSEQDPSRTCALREKGDCALHAYLSLVVDAIQDVSAV
jgi:hypothetical protein